MKRYGRSKWDARARERASTRIHHPAKEEMVDDMDREDPGAGPEAEAASDPGRPGGDDPDSPSVRDGTAPVRWPSVEGELDRALAVVRFLREHCEWDASRTPLSLIPHLQEEAHEVADAIRARDAGALEGELGDLLLNVAFQVVLGEEAGTFDAASISDALEAKMERRHPHIFGDGEREDWEAMKARQRRESSEAGADASTERGESGSSGGRDGETATEAKDTAEGILSGLPAELEPLLRAHRIQERVSGVGFDWAEPMGAWEKVNEELEEVREALERIRDSPDEATRTGLEADLEEELGDLLFAVVNLSRLAGAHASTVLHGANEKFARRFARLETLARERGIDVAEASLEALDALWDELKGEEAE